MIALALKTSYSVVTDLTAATIFHKAFIMICVERIRLTHDYYNECRNYIESYMVISQQNKSLTLAIIIMI